ncbi:MAG: DUF488 family protein [Cellvibrionaceae bacterium]
MQIFTIGYATKPIDIFIAQLKQYEIDVIADIRSVPYSKVFHDYHKESVQSYLKKHQIKYVYLGDELGPRSKDDKHYDESGQVQFSKLMQSPLFQQGIKRIKDGINKEFNIALMCAEKDPATCHRSLLVGYFLKRHNSSENNTQNNITIQHIDHNGNLETQDALEQRLSTLNEIEVDLFTSAEEQQEQAYQLQLKNTSYRKP